MKASPTRQARLKDMLLFSVAAKHGYSSTDELMEAINACATGQPFHLPEEGKALVASGESVLLPFVRLG